jgi:ubiquinone/menaquinone biosynthesis C-methylase UbiE
VSRNPYDELYRQWDFLTNPFGYSVDFLLWLTSKTKKELAKFIIKNGMILDVGGGTGLMAQFLPKFVDKRNYYNLDVSIEMLKYSQYQNIVAAAEYLPFSSETFDYVVSSEALEHVNNKLETLTECYRVLKPEGLFLLSTPRAGWGNDFEKSFFLPFLVMDWIKNKLWARRAKVEVPEGVKNEPSDENWLREKLVDIGFTVLDQYRADNHLPWGNSGESKFWRWFADKFVDDRKYGHCTIVICKK